MMNIFDEDMINNLTPELVSRYYEEHHSKQDLADVYELVHEMWVYHEDCTYDYEEGTPEYENALRVFEKWDALRQMLDEEVLSMLRNHNVNADYLDINTLETFMNMYGYEEHGGWFVKKDAVEVGG